MRIKYKGEDNPNSSHYRILILRIGLQKEVRILCVLLCISRDKTPK
jgi:hypothetical protein